MATTRELVTGTVLYGATEVLNKFIVFALLPLLTVYLSPADFGIQAIVAGLTILLTPIISLGVGASLAPCYFLQEDAEHRRAAVWSAVFALACSVAVFTAVGVTAADFLSAACFGSRGYAHFVTLGIAATAFTVLTIPFRQALQFQGRATSYVALSFVSAVATVVLTIVMIVPLRRGIIGLLEANVVAQGVTLALFAAPAVRNGIGRVKRDLTMRLLKVGVPLIPAFGAVFVLQHVSKYILQWTAGLSAVGIYSLGLSVGLVMSVLVTGFQAAWVPYFMSYLDRPEEARKELGRITTYYVLSFGSASLVLFAVANPLIRVIATPPFHPAWQVVGLSATTQFLNGLFMVLLPGMYYANEIQKSGIIQGIAGIVSIAFSLVMIRYWGVFGAAAAMTLGYVVLVALQYAWNRHRNYVLVEYECGRLTKFACFYVLSATVTLWSSEWSMTNEIFRSVVEAAIVLGFVYLQFSPDERRAAVSAATGRSLFVTNSSVSSPDVFDGSITIR